MIGCVASRTVTWNGVRRPWLPAGPGDGAGRELAVTEEPVRPGLLLARAPATDAGHLVERMPAGKGVVGGVHRYQPAAAVHERLERPLQRRRPAFVRRVVVHDHRLVLRELRFEGREVAAGGWCGHDGHGKQAGLLERLLQHRGDARPVVIPAGALAVEEHDRDPARRLCRNGGRCERESKKESHGVTMAGLKPRPTNEKPGVRYPARQSPATSTPRAAARTCSRRPRRCAARRRASPAGSA